MKNQNQFHSFQYLIGFDCEFTSDTQPKVGELVFFLISKTLSDYVFIRIFPAALMQLACENKIFLLDIPILYELISEEHWMEFVNEILFADSSSNMILGYEPVSDFRALSNTSMAIFGRKHPK